MSYVRLAILGNHFQYTGIRRVDIVMARYARSPLDGGTSVIPRRSPQLTPPAPFSPPVSNVHVIRSSLAPPQLASQVLCRSSPVWSETYSQDDRLSFRRARLHLRVIRTEFIPVVKRNYRFRPSLLAQLTAAMGNDTKPYYFQTSCFVPRGRASYK